VYAFNQSQVPNCNASLAAVVTNERHAQMARHSAAQSIVLLKNDDVLPISRNVRTIAIVGSAAVAPKFNPNNPNQGSLDWATGDYYAGGGSGHTTAPYVVTAFDGISKRAMASGITILNASSDNIAEAIQAAGEADLTIVVAGTSSGESRDRDDLNLDNNANELIAAVSGTGAKVVVLTQICGAILMPWKDDVSGILSLFLGGQETGSAWGDILFGDVAPVGHLPLMIPETDMDQIEPVDSTVVPYSEGMSFSYRNSQFKSAFPFGHGLTYTTFEYGEFTSEPCGSAVCVTGTVTNTGKFAAKTIPQLYLEFPIEAGFPAPVLKGFQKTSLIYPGASAEITFRLTDRDMSYFDGFSDQNGYVPRFSMVDQAVAHVGASSADIKQTVSVISRKADSVETALLI
jgi:beta-glucosidase